MQALAQATTGVSASTGCAVYKRPTRRRCLLARCAVVEPGSTVLVAGATGGVGQLTTAKLLERGYKVRALTRKPEKTKQLFDNHPNLEPGLRTSNSQNAHEDQAYEYPLDVSRLSILDMQNGLAANIATADLREPGSLSSIVDGVDAVCCATGTTAFPSNRLTPLPNLLSIVDDISYLNEPPSAARWEGNNGPKPTDFEAPQNLIRACPKSLKRFVFVTSAGVERQKQFPWLILNTFGVLKFKRASEEALQASGLPYTIIRPSRLTDGPYTSYDLNTLLKASAGSRKEVTLAADDGLLGEASRIAVAEAIVQALQLSSAENRAFALASVEGEGPGEDKNKWDKLFTACYSAAAQRKASVTV